MPVLPLVGSMMTEPCLSTPLSSRYSIIAMPSRSLTEASGLKNSSLPMISALTFSALARRESRTSGVAPMVCSRLS